MIVPQPVIGCGHTALQTLFHLIRPLGRWLGSTILIIDVCKDAVGIPGIRKFLQGIMKKTCIRSHVYGEKSKLTKGVKG